MIDIGVVVITGKEIRADAFGKYRNRKTCVRVAREVYAGFIVEYMSDGDGEGVVRTIEEILLLCVFLH